jgi:hypothetical protein
MSQIASRFFVSVALEESIHGASLDAASDSSLGAIAESPKLEMRWISEGGCLYAD